VATQVVARDRLAALLGAMALLGAALERVGTNLRLLQRTETGEALEPFAPGQKGSSAMPHKRNPVLAERLCGLARLLRSYALAATENVALWDERDISHSSAERVIVADSFLVADYATHLLREMIEGLEVRPEAMRQNLEAGGGLVYSQRVLLALVAAGVARDDAYRRVQRHALAAAKGEGGFRERVSGDPEIGGVLGAKLAGCFDPDALLAHVDDVFERGRAAAGAPTPEKVR
jgi:adenylosuccinate lyase